MPKLVFALRTSSPPRSLPVSLALRFRSLVGTRAVSESAPFDSRTAGRGNGTARRTRSWRWRLHVVATRREIEFGGKGRPTGFRISTTAHLSTSTNGRETGVGHRPNRRGHFRCSRGAIKSDVEHDRRHIVAFSPYSSLEFVFAFRFRESSQALASWSNSESGFSEADNGFQFRTGPPACSPAQSFSRSTPATSCDRIRGRNRPAADADRAN